MNPTKWLGSVQTYRITDIACKWYFKWICICWWVFFFLVNVNGIWNSIDWHIFYWEDAWTWFCIRHYQWERKSRTKKTAMHTKRAGWIAEQNAQSKPRMDGQVVEIAKKCKRFENFIAMGGFNAVVYLWFFFCCCFHFAFAFLKALLVPYILKPLAFHCFPIHLAALQLSSLHFII